MYGVYCKEMTTVVEVGKYNQLKVLRKVEFGLYLDDGKDGILLPKRFVPANAREGDTLTVFVYHDSEDRLVATTQQPKAVLGDIAFLTCVGSTPQGAFLDMGLMKDLFVPKSRQQYKMFTNGQYWVKVYLDEETGRMAATSKLDSGFSNDVLTVKEKEEVTLKAYRKTDIGILVIINDIHTGVLHYNEIFRNIEVGDCFKGFIRAIHPEGNKIDVIAGKPGFQRVDAESEKILSLLEANNGFLPFTDKSAPDLIYSTFGMSKKTFKITIGNLYKQRKLIIENDGIRLSAK